MSYLNLLDDSTYQIVYRHLYNDVIRSLQSEFGQVAELRRCIKEILIRRSYCADLFIGDGIYVYLDDDDEGDGFDGMVETLMGGSDVVMSRAGQGCRETGWVSTSLDADTVTVSFHDSFKNIDELRVFNVRPCIMACI